MLRSARVCAAVAAAAAAAVLLLCAPALGAEQALEVQTDKGTVVGERASNGGRNFFGVPFAAAPIGQARFRPPQPASAWTTLDTKVKPPACPQQANDEDPTQSEDCLFLNVYTPAGEEDDTRSRPVILWIYGGSFTSGSVSYPHYDGRRLADQGDVVFVALNYRLGFLGWAYFDALADEDSEHPTSGNYGLLDQRMGMKWVHDNIAAFGGDPARVTLVGESAGGISVCMHLFMPDSWPYFRRAVSMSGPCLQGNGDPKPAFTVDASRSISNDVRDALGCDQDNADNMVACLRGKSTADIVTAQLGVIGQTHQGFSPSVDMNVIPDDPRSLALSGKNGVMAPGVDIIFGNVKDEGTLFTPQTLTKEEFRAQLESDFSGSDNKDKLVETVYERYNPTDEFPNAYLAASGVLGDAFFTCSGRQLLRAYRKAGNSRVYQYEFAHHSSYTECPNGPYCNLEPLGVFHSSELAYMFGNPLHGALFSPDETRIRDTMMSMFSSFAESGEPIAVGDAAPPGSGRWFEFGADGSESYLRFGETAADTTQQTDFKKDECDFWDGLTTTHGGGGGKNGPGAGVVVAITVISVMAVAAGFLMWKHNRNRRVVVPDHLTDALDGDGNGHSETLLGSDYQEL